MNELLLFLVFALVVGIRHGFDLDHIAAIFDITASQKEKTRAFLFSALYALGHGLVVTLLGLSLLSFGHSLPKQWDILFEQFVGITLIFLGLYVLFSLFRNGSRFKIKSKWMLIFEGIAFGYHKILHNLNLEHHHPKIKGEKYGSVSSLGLGMIHGVGAETPTQISAFLVLLGIGKGFKSILFLIFFVSGIFISNLLVASLSLYGYRRFMENQKIYIGIGVTAAVFSILLGLIFLRG